MIKKDDLVGYRHTTQVWVLRSQSLTWPSANAAKTRGTSPNQKRWLQCLGHKTEDARENQDK